MLISAVIVTYQPDIRKLSDVISSLENQVDQIILVKNSSEALSFQKCDIIQLNENKGIAYAQNRGIEYAIDHGMEWILLSDQDTVFPVEYIKNILKCAIKDGKSNIYVPAFFNETKNQIEPVAISIKDTIPPIGDNPISLFHAISSGSFFNKAVYQKIGGGDESLFIDYVDFEWCWRAKSYGILTVCLPNIVINHQLGDSYKKILGKKVTIRSSMRYYYMIRNGVYLGSVSQFLTKSEKRILYNRSMMYALGVVLVSSRKIEGLKLVIKAIHDAKEMTKKRKINCE